VKGSLQQIVKQSQQAIAASVKLPTGVFIEFTGAAEAEAQTGTQLYMYSGLALALIVMILFVSFHWRRQQLAGAGESAVQYDRQRAGDRGYRIGISLGTVVGLVTVFGVSAATPSCSSLTTSTWWRWRVLRGVSMW